MEQPQSSQEAPQQVSNIPPQPNNPKKTNPVWPVVSIVLLLLIGAGLKVIALTSRPDDKNMGVNTSESALVAPTSSPDANNSVAIAPDSCESIYTKDQISAKIGSEVRLISNGGIPSFLRCSYYSIASGSDVSSVQFEFQVDPDQKYFTQAREYFSSGTTSPAPQFGSDAVYQVQLMGSDDPNTPNNDHQLVVYNKGATYFIRMDELRNTTETEKFLAEAMNRFLGK